MHLTRRTGILLLAALAGPATADIVSIADWPCREWLARRQSGERVDPPQMWLSGFMTGLASAHNVDALAIIDAPSLFAWMDDYCGRQPEDAISSGGLVLFDELKRRLPTTQPRLSLRTYENLPAPAR